MDAITLLKRDHRTVEKLFKRFEKATQPAEQRKMIENVGYHVEEEESELFPEVRKVVKRKELAELGDALEKAKKTAPTSPHPRAPDTPPGNLVAGRAAGVVDKARSKVKKKVGSR